MQTLSPVWHPFTQHAFQPEAISVLRAEGAYLETSAGQRLYDAIASWWVITHGHCHPRIVTAIREQAERLDQVIFAGFTHEPAERLARGLIAIAPSGLSHVFYSDSGSTAVEVGLKMALGFWRNRGANRHRIVALDHSYHGDTIGGMSVGARGVFNASYEPLLFSVERIPAPLAAARQVSLDRLEQACRRDDTAALIIEPLILGAGGMLMYDAATLATMHDICRRHGVLFIADEVMTGFGRTGTLFACNQAGITPDILCIAKGITGGSIPLAATLCIPEIFAAYYATDRTRTFFHSSSYTANPIACAAALANLSVWAEEPVEDRLRQLNGWQQQGLARFENDLRFSNMRCTGTIAALDVVVPDANEGYMSAIGPHLYAHFLARDLLIRPLGSTIYLMPPYCSTKDDLNRAYDAIDAWAGIG